MCRCYWYKFLLLVFSPPALMIILRIFKLHCFTQLRSYDLYPLFFASSCYSFGRIVPAVIRQNKCSPVYGHYRLCSESFRRHSAFLGEHMPVVPVDAVLSAVGHKQVKITESLVDLFKMCTVTRITAFEYLMMPVFEQP